MKLNVYKFKYKRVIILSTHIIPKYSDAGYSDDRLDVEYRVLEDNGKIGKRQTKEIWECDFYCMFHETDEEVELTWKPSNG